MRESDLWDRFVTEVSTAAQDRYAEDLWETTAWAAVIAQAGKDRDGEYFTSSDFEHACWLLRLKPQYVYTAVKKIWETYGARHG